MNRCFQILCLVVCVFAIEIAPAAEDVEPKDPAQKHSYWMKKKLEWSQSLLACIANADWDRMARDARNLRALSKIEGRFRRTDQEAYRDQLAVFDRANDQLIEAANEENIDGATLAYLHLIHSCVNCHKSLRKEAQPKKLP